MTRKLFEFVVYIFLILLVYSANSFKYQMAVADHIFFVVSFVLVMLYYINNRFPNLGTQSQLGKVLSGAGFILGVYWMITLWW